MIATTLRTAQTATRNDWGAVAIYQDEIINVPQRTIEGFDRVRRADSFAAGLIYGMLTGRTAQWAVECGVAHGSLAMTTPGDTSMASRPEVENLMRVPQPGSPDRNFMRVELDSRAVVGTQWTSRSATLSIGCLGRGARGRDIGGRHHRHRSHDDLYQTRFDLIRGLKEKYDEAFCLGAGTVISLDQCTASIEAGAEFIVSPSVHCDVIAKRKVAIPGALIPTEVMQAWIAGADYVKVFPCSAMGGPSYLKSLKAPFPQSPLIPTAGGNHGKRLRII